MNNEGTLEEIAAKYGVSRERIRQIEADGKQKTGLGSKYVRMKTCQRCSKQFYSNLAKKKYCGSSGKEKTGCMAVLAKEYWRSDRAVAWRKEYQVKLKEKRLANIKIKVCANPSCKKEFKTWMPGKKYCGSFSKGTGCSYNNQHYNRKGNLPNPHCIRCGIKIELSRNAKGRLVGSNKKYCGFARLYDINVGEGCAYIVHLNKYYAKVKNPSVRLAERLAVIKDPLYDKKKRENNN